MVNMDAFASAFGFDAKSDGVWTTLGKVTSVNGSTLSVLLGGSATPTECEAYCLASVGDVVFVAITKGRARAIACRGVDAAAWRSALGLGSMATEDASDYLALTGGTVTGVLTVEDTVELGYGSEIWDNSNRIVHIRTAANSSNKRADFTLEPDGKIYRRTSSDGGSTWSSWSAIAG